MLGREDCRCRHNKKEHKIITNQKKKEQKKKNYKEEDMPQPGICAGLRHVFVIINIPSERSYFVPKILSPASPSPGQM